MKAESFEKGTKVYMSPAFLFPMAKFTSPPTAKPVEVEDVAEEVAEAEEEDRSEEVTEVEEEDSEAEEETQEEEEEEDLDDFKE
eukprot:CAMPEP_0202944332 /NCGR_PEP_ID=MMETSP1395-20130829/5078_1 /ASSEMBLY_ACC=CAM_ASM_000871 /TAXON_ID=5961 /ORGANISM="Blepharisma japonicum, Strain Stock R1072" /LENGTH=83 /DNA_ID=CAMNT_0049642971 /DNA_START=276 /DNA_END=528 /DNA_ORIENTATION=-